MVLDAPAFGGYHCERVKPPFTPVLDVFDAIVRPELKLASLLLIHRFNIALSALALFIMVELKSIFVFDVNCSTFGELTDPFHLLTEFEADPAQVPEPEMVASHP